MTGNRMQHLINALGSTAWAIQPEKLAAVLGFLEVRLSGRKFSDEERAERIGTPEERAERAAFNSMKAASRPMASSGGGSIAVLPITGVIAHRMAMVQDVSGPGGTSTEGFKRQLEAALNDESVSAIVLDIDSPGGTVSGVAELAQFIYESRGQKKIIAVANSLAASAAYWIAAAADEVVVTPTGDVGSIGVFTVHVDQSALDEATGLKFTMIAAGKYKVEGHSHAALDEEAEAALQARVDDFYSMFTKDVGKYRGVPAAKVRSGFGEGRIVRARQAVELGMADRVATLDEVLVKLGAKRGGARTPMAAAAAADAQPRLAAESPSMNEISASTAETINGSTGVGAIASMSKVVLISGSAPEDADRSEGSQVLTEPAQKAKEKEMSDKAPAANEAAPTAPAQPLASARSVAAELANLAKEHGFVERTAELLGQAETLESGTKVVLGWIRERNAGGAKVTTPGARITGGIPNEATRPFGSFGEQMRAVIKAERGPIDQRLLHLNSVAGMNAASGMSEGVGSEGGFAVQHDFLPDIVEPAYTVGNIASRVERVPIGEGKNGLTTLEVDEDSRVTGQRWGGIRMYWMGEGQTKDPSKAKLRPFSLQLRKLGGFYYSTEELSEDASALGVLLQKGFRTELQFMVEDSIVNGPGGSEPLGIQNGGAVISVAIEAGQTIANTSDHIALNVAKMMARMPAELLNEAVFTYNPELLPYLLTATLGNTPVFLPAGGISGVPFNTIFGRPAFASPYNAALGTPGDIQFNAFSAYRTIDKGGVKEASSLHVRFLYGEECFRITYRTDGAPRVNKAVTPHKGSATQSPFVRLAVRS